MCIMYYQIKIIIIIQNIKSYIIQYQIKGIKKSIKNKRNKLIYVV